MNERPLFLYDLGNAIDQQYLTRKIFGKPHYRYHESMPPWLGQSGHASSAKDKHQDESEPSVFDRNADILALYFDTSHFQPDATSLPKVIDWLAQSSVIMIVGMLLISFNS